MAKQKKVVLVPVKFMVDERQLQFWEKSLKKLKYPLDLAIYIKYSTDRSIGLDFQSKSKRWQKFLAAPAVQKLAKKILGYGLVDNLKTQYHMDKAIEDIEKQKKKKG